MPRPPRIVPVVQPIPPVNGAAAPPLDDGDVVIPQTQLDRIALALTATPDPRSKVKVLRDNAWCADFKPSEWEAGGFELVRRRFGSGTYTVLVYGKADGRQFGIVMREEVEVAADLAAPVAEAPKPADAAGTSTDALLRAVLERLTAPPPPPAADADPMAAALKQMQMLRELRDVFAPPPAPKSTLAESLELMRALRAAAAEFQGKDTDSGWRDLLEVLKPLVPAIVKAAVPAIAAPPAPAPSETEPELDPVAIESALAQLLEWAAAKAPIPPAAELVLEALPDELIDALHRDDWWPLLTQSLPQFEPHKDWMHTLRGAVLEADTASPNTAG